MFNFAADVRLSSRLLGFHEPVTYLTIATLKKKRSVKNRAFFFWRLVKNRAENHKVVCSGADETESRYGD